MQLYAGFLQNLLPHGHDLHWKMRASDMSVQYPSRCTGLKYLDTWKKERVLAEVLTCKILEHFTKYVIHYRYQVLNQVLVACTCTRVTSKYVLKLSESSLSWWTLVKNITNFRSYREFREYSGDISSLACYRWDEWDRLVSHQRRIDKSITQYWLVIERNNLVVPESLTLYIPVIKGEKLHSTGIFIRQLWLVVSGSVYINIT